MRERKDNRKVPLATARFTFAPSTRRSLDGLSFRVHLSIADANSAKLAELVYATFGARARRSTIPDGIGNTRLRVLRGQILTRRIKGCLTNGQTLRVSNVAAFNAARVPLCRKIQTPIVSMISSRARDEWREGRAGARRPRVPRQ